MTQPGHSFFLCFVCSFMAKITRKKGRPVREGERNGNAYTVGRTNKRRESARTDSLPQNLAKTPEHFT